jgi:hypothetical protein
MTMSEFDNDPADLIPARNQNRKGHFVKYVYTVEIDTDDIDLRLENIPFMQDLVTTALNSVAKQRNGTPLRYAMNFTVTTPDETKIYIKIDPNDTGVDDDEDESDPDQES